MSNGRHQFLLGLVLVFLCSTACRLYSENVQAAMAEAALTAKENPTGVETKPSDQMLDPDVRARALGSLRRGLNWLKTVQRDDGSWSNPNFPALTALGLWAFCRSDHPDRATVCAKAAEFVASFAQKDGGIYKVPTGGRGSGGLSTYNTAVCMVALHAYDKHKYAPIILAARKFVSESQLVGDSPGAGGFGYERTPSVQLNEASKSAEASRGDLSNTGWVLQAMRLTQDVEDLRPVSSPVDINWAQALRFIERLQHRDPSDEAHYGGFGYSTRGERAGVVPGQDGAVRLATFGSMTYAGLEAMIYAQVDRTDPRVQSAVQWAARHWSVDENPGMGLKGVFYYYTVMAKALTAAGVDSLKRPSGGQIPWKKQLVEKLVQLQRPDGSWVNSDNTYWENDAALVTSYAALTLEYILGW